MPRQMLVSNLPSPVATASTRQSHSSIKIRPGSRTCSAKHNPTRKGFLHLPSMTSRGRGAQTRDPPGIPLQPLKLLKGMESQHLHPHVPFLLLLRLLLQLQVRSTAPTRLDSSPTRTTAARMPRSLLRRPLSPSYLLIVDRHAARLLPGWETLEDCLLGALGLRSQILLGDGGEEVGFEVGAEGGFGEGDMVVVGLKRGNGGWLRAPGGRGRYKGWLPEETFSR
ncbi:hypothetical protein KC338_g8 [Hortaea werneckii]|nr:hypothetical protein KC338_g8 [Hortaea werneckii]